MAFQSQGENPDMTLVVTGCEEHWTASMDYLGALWNIWGCLWDIGCSVWMVLCLQGKSWVAGRQLRVSMDCLGSLCNVCSCGQIQGVMKQITGSMTTPPKKNTMTCNQDPPEVIQVGVMSLPLRNDSHP